MKCSYCDKEGHNLRTCPDVRRCGICNQPGHNSRTCDKTEENDSSSKIEENECVIYCYITGVQTNVICDIKKKVKALVKDKDSYKIGITNNPEGRFINAYRNNGYDEMHVVYKTTSLASIRKSEIEIIEQHWDDCDNQISGGGGNYGNSPYYLYIVIKYS